jgi:pimeloyl-ACP methyl ester carboxylesterase
MLPAAAALAERGYPVYAIDWFYHGRTSVDGSRTVDSLDMIEALIQTIQPLHGGQMVGIAGSSYGGDLAVLYALCEARQCRESGRPRTVGSVVGQGLITHWQRGVSGRFSIGLTLIHVTEPAPIGLLMPPYIRTNWLFRLPQLYDSRELRRQFRHDPLRVRWYPANLVVRVTRRRADLTGEPVFTPLLVLEGSRDRLVRPKYEEHVFRGLQRYMPNSEYHLLEGATHGMFEEHTLATVDEIDAWFRRSLPSGCRVTQNR